MHWINSSNPHTNAYMYLTIDILCSRSYSLQCWWRERNEKQRIKNAYTHWRKDDLFRAIRICFFSSIFLDRYKAFDQLVNNTATMTKESIRMMDLFIAKQKKTLQKIYSIKKENISSFCLAFTLLRSVFISSFKCSHQVHMLST